MILRVNHTTGNSCEQRVRRKCAPRRTTTQGYFLVVHYNMWVTLGTKDLNHPDLPIANTGRSASITFHAYHHPRCQVLLIDVHINDAVRRRTAL